MLVQIPASIADGLETDRPRHTPIGQTVFDTLGQYWVCIVDPMGRTWGHGLSLEQAGRRALDLRDPDRQRTTITAEIHIAPDGVYWSSQTPPLETA